MAPHNFWYTPKEDIFSPGVQLSLKVKNILYKEKSKYQTIEVIDTYSFGKMLLLDGVVMFSEKDEFAYHEMLIHPAITAHPNPKKILVIGGGDGGAIREILKYDIQKIFLIDIDEMVISVCKKYFTQMTKGFDDKRVEVINMDGALYVKETKEKFDIIFVDSTDPIPQSPGVSLIKDEFFVNCKNILNEYGIWVAQTESPFLAKNFVISNANKLKKIFSIVKIYITNVPSFGGAWSFTYASDRVEPTDIKRDAPNGLKYYNKEIHKAAFAIPEYLK